MNYDDMEAERERLKNIILSGEGGCGETPARLIAAGGWCAPPINYSDMFAPPINYFDMFAPMTDAETIVYLRKALADEKFKVKSLRRTVKLQRKRIQALEHVLAEQVIING